MKKKNMYNEKKLTPIFETMKPLKVLQLGAGAIGSFICEALTRNGVGYLAIVDKDYFEEDNLPKSSFVVQYPEDINISKAHALANRLSVFAKDGCTIKGFNMDIKKLGPMAFSEFDYIVLALDSTAIRIFAQKLVKMCPEQRPIVLSCGTTGETSEAMLFSPKGACLRCTIPNAWLKSENPETVHSCAAKVNYLLPEKEAQIVSTSGIASMKSALDIDDMITAHATGAKTFEHSERYSQSPYPQKNGHSAKIAKHPDCPVCSLTPPEKVTTIKGSTYSTTLREFLNNIKSYFDGDFRLKVHVLEIPGVPEQVYDQFVITDRCKFCGKEFRICKHTGEIRENQIICDDCLGTAHTSLTRFDTECAVEARYFSLNETDDELLDTPLFMLGYPIGCYYEVEEIIAETNAKELASEISLDDFTLGDIAESKTFTLREDKFFLISE